MAAVLIHLYYCIVGRQLLSSAATSQTGQSAVNTCVWHTVTVMMMMMDGLNDRLPNIKPVLEQAALDKSRRCLLTGPGPRVKR